MNTKSLFSIICTIALLSSQLYAKEPDYSQFMVNKAQLKAVQEDKAGTVSAASEIANSDTAAMSENQAAAQAAGTAALNGQVNAQISAASTQNSTMSAATSSADDIISRMANISVSPSSSPELARDLTANTSRLLRLLDQRKVLTQNGISTSIGELGVPSSAAYSAGDLANQLSSTLDPTSATQTINSMKGDLNGSTNAISNLAARSEEIADNGGVISLNIDPDELKDDILKIDSKMLSIFAKTALDMAIEANGDAKILNPYSSLEKPTYLKGFAVKDYIFKNDELCQLIENLREKNVKGDLLSMIEIGQIMKKVYGYDL